MFLNNFLIQVSIIVGIIALFLLSYYFNRKVKPPKGTKLPDKCHTCPTDSCIIKMTYEEDKELKDDIKEFIDKCEKEQQNETK